MPDKRFARTIDDVVESSLTFSDHPEYWREAVGSSPKYFTHIVEQGRHCFGLSKYCAFRNVEVRQYVSRLRNTTNGNITQRHISKLADTTWTPYSKSNPQIRRAFVEWIHSFFPKYQLNNASFISLSRNGTTSERRRRKPSVISPDNLQKKLRRQTEIGRVGELIALKHEIERLRKAGIPNPEECVEHVSLVNSAAGFDIWSRPSKTSVRFIEVKASTSTADTFFITKNEVDTLKEHGSDAFLYFVFVKDISKREGKVVSELQDPIKHFESNGSLEPILFRAELDNTEK
jgi:hypothetical protein